MPSNHLEKYKYTVDKCVAALIVQARLLKSKHRAVKRLTLMKQRRDRRRREFVTRQAIERLMPVCDADVYDIWGSIARKDDLDKREE